MSYVCRGRQQLSEYVSEQNQAKQIVRNLPTLHINWLFEIDTMIVIGSRGSALALAQTAWIRDRIFDRFPDAEVSVKIIKTSADNDPTTSIRSGSTIGVFVREIEQALLNGDIDLAVHSMKDLPTQMPAGLKIAAIPEREDARDALISEQANNLSGLLPNSRIGTGSIRRQAQMLALRPDLKITDIRGNIDTRLKKLKSGSYDALILACAGLNRLGLQNEITDILDFKEMLPAPGQGALAIQIRKDDWRVEPFAAALNHGPSYAAVTSERAFLHRMGGGCNVPVAAYARKMNNSILIEGMVASPDGAVIIRDSIRESIESADQAAAALADVILARGGRAILKGL
jgi:hydroxymethylbilane synthase